MSEEQATYDPSPEATMQKVIPLFYTGCGALLSHIAVVVTIGVMGDWAAYIGSAPATISEAGLVGNTVRFGNKLPEDIARAFAKSGGYEHLFKDRPYRE